MITKSYLTSIEEKGLIDNSYSHPYLTLNNNRYIIIHMTDEHLEKFRKIFKPKYDDENDIRIHNELKKIDKIMNNKKLSRPNKEQLQRSKRTIIWLLKRKEK